MKLKRKLYFIIGGCSLLCFALWTALCLLVDRAPIGPLGSVVGFSRFNSLVHSLTGVSMELYVATDWMGLVPIFTAVCYFFTGCYQWIKRRRLLSVDMSLIALGFFYAAVIGFYVGFEYAVINYRPILIGGNLEASYPSSTTLLVLTVMPTAAMQISQGVKSRRARWLANISIFAFCALMLIGRFLSGVHWASDIIGAIFLSAALDLLYFGAIKKNN